MLLMGLDAAIFTSRFVLGFILYTYTVFMILIWFDLFVFFVTLVYKLAQHISIQIPVIDNRVLVFPNSAGKTISTLLTKDTKGGATTFSHLSNVFSELKIFYVLNQPIKKHLERHQLTSNRNPKERVGS